MTKQERRDSERGFTSEPFPGSYDPLPDYPAFDPVVIAVAAFGILGLVAVCGVVLGWW